jgi:acyl carrier protein
MPPTTLTQEQLDARVIDVLVGFGVPREKITPEADLRTLDVDSLDVVELAQILHDDYGIDIEARDFTDSRVFADIMNAVHRRAGLK